SHNARKQCARSVSPPSRCRACFRNISRPVHNCWAAIPRLPLSTSAAHRRKRRVSLHSFVNTWVTAENFQNRTVLSQYLEGRGNFPVLGMAFDVYVHEILPGFPPRRATFDLAQTDFPMIEGTQCGEKRARLVLQTKHDGGAIVSGRRTGLPADDEKSRRVVVPV